MMVGVFSKRAWYMSFFSFLFFCVWVTWFFPNYEYMSLSEFYVISKMNFSLIVLSFWVVGMSLLGSQSYSFMKNKYVMFAGLLWFLVLVVVWFFLSDNLLVFYVCFELSLIPMVLIIFGWGYQPERFVANNYFVMYTVSSSLPLLLSVLYVVGSFGTSSFICLSYMNMFIGDFSLWSIFFLLAFLVKLPIFGAHLWLPKAHVEAPVAGSMILAGILLKLGGFGAMQFVKIFPGIVFGLSGIIISLGLIGGIYVSLFCLRQTDMKSLIAYSSVAHMGVFIAGVLSFKFCGWLGASIMMISHGLSSSSMFFTANVLYMNFCSRKIFFMKGFGTLIPLFMLWWVLNIMGNMATPPFLSLVGEIYIYLSLISGFGLLSFIVIILMFLTGVYSVYLYVCCSHGQVAKMVNLWSSFSPINSLIFFGHLWPLFGLCMKLDLFYL